MMVVGLGQRFQKDDLELFRRSQGSLGSIEFEEFKAVTSKRVGMTQSR